MFIQSTKKSVLNYTIGKDNQKIFEVIENDIGINSIDVIIGGPPCQAYSIISRSIDKNKMKNDPRNLLYIEYGKFLQRYQPKVFVFENVLGLITADQGSYFKNMQLYFQQIGYKLHYTIQKAEDFGVLQKKVSVNLIALIQLFTLTEFKVAFEKIFVKKIIN